ncbi:hypothetical protein AAEO50_03900 [Rossellomorea oryzaecorticis]|uniref:Uncharacterized protein n=2 Tax=Rossellomorea oryzaecorticis TaxID=1396505 RepID=A0ABU9K5U9_9BACI
MFFATTSSATSWAYPFVVWDGYRFEVLDEYVEEIDSEIGEVTSYSDMETLSGNFSNEYIEGTKYYSIKGISTDEAIAVKTGSQYKKAVRIGEYKTGIRVKEKNNLFTFVVISAAAASILIFYLRRR